MNFPLFTYFFFVVFSTLCMSYFSMQEMAIISCNRLRLEVAAKRGDKKAKLILYFLTTPTLLFGTTLIGVNLFLVVSSEAARQLFIHLNLSPNYSPFLHIPYVLIMGELVPMFIARAFPERISRIGIPLLSLFSKIVQPILYPFHRGMKKFSSYFSASIHSHHIHLVRDELFKLIEEAHMAPSQESPNRLGLLSEALFQAKEYTLGTLLRPLAALEKTLTQQQIKKLPRLQLDDSLFYALQQVYEAQAEYGILLDKQESEVGVIYRNELSNQLFAPALAVTAEKKFIDKTLDANFPLAEFAAIYKITLPSTNVKTFQEILEKILDRKPRVGDTILFGPLDVTVLKAGVLGAKKIKVKTHRW